jgi:eukaryotic-like serine/threonine-protein kinase
VACGRRPSRPVRPRGARALVLELVEGPTLEDRLTKGALPVKDALAIARQIADALDAAHEKGIVHRDLKPSNIKITAEGVVKVLDFGLAKLALGTSSGSGQNVAHRFSPDDLSQSPTFSLGGTKAGAVLGTAAYMSPEQARGQAVDKRTDIWAFGCVLYEMLTGRAVFARNTISDTLVAILEREPDWTVLPTSTPATVRRLLERCLTKDPKLRLRDIGDVTAEIEAPAWSGSAAGGPTRRPSWWTTSHWVASLILTAVGTGILVWTFKPSGSSPASTSGSVARLVIASPPGDPIAVDGASMAISPDGGHVAFVAGVGSRRRIYLRDIDDFNSTPIPGTEGANSPFFSPDGQWLGFIADGRMRKTTLTAGPPQTITETMQIGGTFTFASWESDDTILFTPAVGTGIWRVSAAGGAPTAVTTLTETENGHRWPQLLPGGKTLLFSAATASDLQAYALSLDTGERRPLVKGVGVRYLSSGHLVYVQGSTLMAVPFDPVRLEVTGTPVAVLSGFMQVATLRNGTVASLAPLVNFSTGKSIAYVPASGRPKRNAIVWVDRAGVEQPTAASGGAYFQPRLSPDGRRVAVTVSGPEHDDVWLYDLTREAWSRFTSEGNSAFPLWTLDGRRLTFVSDKAGPDNMYWKPLDGSGPEERLLANERPNYSFSWSQTGSLAYVVVHPRALQDIWILSSEQPRKPSSFLETPFGEGAPVFSPDGRSVAYVSNESGRNEIHVRPFPGPGERITISTEGGNEPVWSRNGREVFYRTGDAMMVVDVATRPTFSAGKPRRLFERRYEPTLALWPNYDVTSDGQRFLVVKTLDQDPTPPQINVVLNWFDELKRLVPTGRTD